MQPRTSKNHADQKQNWLVSSASLHALSDWSGTCFIINKCFQECNQEHPRTMQIRSRTGWYLVLLFTVSQTGAAHASSSTSAFRNATKNHADQKQNWLVSSASLHGLSDWSGTCFIINKCFQECNQEHPRTMQIRSRTVWYLALPFTVSQTGAAHAFYLVPNSVKNSAPASSWIRSMFKPKNNVSALGFSCKDVFHVCQRNLRFSLPFQPLSRRLRWQKALPDATLAIDPGSLCSLDLSNSC